MSIVSKLIPPCPTVLLKHSPLVCLDFQGKRLPGSLEGWQELSPKKHNEMPALNYSKICATGKIIVCNNNFCKSYNTLALRLTLCWGCICSVFLYLQSKDFCLHMIGWCPVSFIGKLIIFVLELAVKEIRKVKHSRVAVVAWQLKRTVTSGSLNFFWAYRSLCHYVTIIIPTMPHFSYFLINR